MRTLYTRRKPDELAKLLGLGVKQEEFIPITPTSSFSEEVSVGEEAAAYVKESDILEKIIDSEDTESFCDLETIGGDEEEEGEGGNKEAKLENKKIKADEYKTKLASDLDGLYCSSGLLDTFQPHQSRDGKESKDKREKVKESRTEAAERKAEGFETTNSRKKMFKEVFNTDKTQMAMRQVQKEGDDGQFEMESPSASEEVVEIPEKDGDWGQVEQFDNPQAEGEVQSGVPQIEKKSESTESSGKRPRRGSKELDWRQVEHFESPQAFNRSQIKEELDRQMIKNLAYRNSGARNESYVCKFYKKQAWKTCRRKYRVMYLNTSFAIVVMTTSDEHHHEEEPGFTTKENYHWTAQQEEIVAQSLITHMKNTLVLEELRWFNLVNGSGKLPTLLQVSNKKKYMKLAREKKENPGGRLKNNKKPSPRGRPKKVETGVLTKNEYDTLRKVGGS